jgi:hypothetical protein
MMPSPVHRRRGIRRRPVSCSRRRATGRRWNGQRHQQVPVPGPGPARRRPGWLVAHAEDGAASGVHHVDRSQPYLPVSSPTEKPARSVLKRHHAIVRLRPSLAQAQRAAGRRPAAAAAVSALVVVTGSGDGRRRRPGTTERKRGGRVVVGRSGGRHAHLRRRTAELYYGDRRRGSGFGRDINA